MSWSEDVNADPNVISIGPWLTPQLISETVSGEAKVIPIRPGVLPRAEGRRRLPWRHLLIAGICWVVVALL